MDQEIPQKATEEPRGTTESSNISPASSGEVTTSTAPLQEPYYKKNIYPSLRHILLVSFVIMCMALILFLMHQNGKSIYDNGL